MYSVKHFYIPVCALVENPLSFREEFFFSKALDNIAVTHRLPVNETSKPYLVLFTSYGLPSLKAEFFLETLVRILEPFPPIS